MNKFRFDAICAELPFLSGIFSSLSIEHREIKSIKVQRVDENLLKRVLIDHYLDGSAGRSILKETLRAIMPDGKIADVDVVHSYYWNSNYSGSQKVEHEGEAILEGLVGLEDAVYLVLHHHELDDWSGQSYSNEHTFTVFKASRSTTIAQEINKARALASQEVRRELDF